MTQTEANQKFTMAVNRVIKQLESTKPIFDDYKKSEREDCDTSNAEDAVILLESTIEELSGVKDDFQSIVDEDIEDEFEEEDEDIDDLDDLPLDDNPIEEDEH